MDRDYPFQVRVHVPPFGLGQRLNDMHDFCRGRNYVTMPDTLHVKGDGMAWCFADLADAEAFRRKFGASARLMRPASPRSI